MRIPLGMKAYRRLANFQPEVELVNLIVEQDESGASPDGIARIMRPGLDLVDSVSSGGVRGIFRQSGFFNGSRFKVTGFTLFRDGAILGSIDGTDPVAWAAGIGYVFILGGGVLYWSDGVTTGRVDLPNEAIRPVDIEALNSYVFVACSDGTVYWVVPGENEIDALNFITAESAPDGLVACRRLESELFLFGTVSTEPWQLTGDQDAVIQKAVGRQYERGALSRDTVRRFDNSIVWVSENGNVCRAGAQPEIIADEGISERIRKRSGPLSAMVFSFDRHEMYCLRIDGQGSFLYDASSRGWCRFQSQDDVLWNPHVCTSDETGTFLAGPQYPDLLTLNPDSALDVGVPIAWRVTGNIPVLGKPERNDNFSALIGAGSDTQIRLRWRDADEAYPDYYEEIDIRAPADAGTFYRLGSVKPPFRAYELSGSGVRIRIGEADTEAWQ